MALKDTTILTNVANIKPPFGPYKDSTTINCDVLIINPGDAMRGYDVGRFPPRQVFKTEFKGRDDIKVTKRSEEVVISPSNLENVESAVYVVSPVSGKTVSYEKRTNLSLMDLNELLEKLAREKCTRLGIPIHEVREDPNRVYW